MNIRSLFKQEHEVINQLPEKPKVFWYVSAGDDFRPPVFLTDTKIDYFRKNENRQLPKPDLFVYNCIGHETKKLFENLSSSDKPVLFDDRGTRITGRNFQHLTLKEEIQQSALNKNNIQSYTVDHFDKIGAFYFEVVLEDRDKIETQKILYFEYENFHFFQDVILKSAFDVNYLCATREGIGFGGGKKSIIELIYKEGFPDFYYDQGFRPKFVLTFRDFTDNMFCDSIYKSENFCAKKDFVPYIRDHNNDIDTFVYKIVSDKTSYQKS